MEPIVLFINGEYWGLYLIQENFNDDFIEKNYLIPKKMLLWRRRMALKKDLKKK